MTSNTWTIGKKLFAGYLALFGVSLVLGIASLLAISSISGMLENAINSTTKKLVYAADISEAGSDMLAAQRGVLLYKALDNPAAYEQSRRLGETALQRWRSGIDGMRPLLVTAEGKRLTNVLEQEMTGWGQAFAEMERLATAGDVPGAQRVASSQGLPRYEASRSYVKQLEIQLEKMLSEDRQRASAVQVWSNVSVGVSLVIAVLVAIVGLWVVRNINHVLQRTARQLDEAAGYVAVAANQISSASSSLARGVAEQASAVEETSASTEEINAMAHNNSEAARKAAEVSKRSQQDLDGTNRSLAGMVSAIGDINESSSKISRIIKVIDEIAFQTNILALNAAVEAARAGEAGMGFAVVADEVRNLAQRCAQAARETATLIEESVTRSQEGQDRVSEMKTAMGLMTTEANEISRLVEGVDMGSQEQARGLDQMTQALSKIEQVTRSAAASAEESAAAAEELNTQAASLKTTVAELTSMVGR